MNSFVLRMIQKIFFTLMIAFFFCAVVRADDSASTFKAKCAMCHGADGTGNSPTGKAMKVRDLSSPDVQSQTDAQLTDILTNGKNKMPAYKGKLTDEQIKGLVAYIRSMAKK
jgi:cytochrome c6